MVLKEKKWTWSNVRCPKKIFYLLWKLPFNSSTELMYTYNMSGTQNTLKLIQINLFLCLSFVSSFQIAIQSPCDRWQFSRRKKHSKEHVIVFFVDENAEFRSENKTNRYLPNRSKPKFIIIYYTTNRRSNNWFCFTYFYHIMSFFYKLN